MPYVNHFLEIRIPKAQIRQTNMTLARMRDFRTACQCMCTKIMMDAYKPRRIDYAEIADKSPHLLKQFTAIHIDRINRGHLPTVGDILLHILSNSKQVSSFAMRHVCIQTIPQRRCRSTQRPDNQLILMITYVIPSFTFEAMPLLPDECRSFVPRVLSSANGSPPL